jgi:hypothetical protein
MTGAMPLAAQKVGAKPLQAQSPVAAKYQILILEGEGAINNVRQRVAREVQIRVVDENRKPLSEGLVTFSLPKNGASGTFSNGKTSMTVKTDAEGRAKIQNMHLNHALEKMLITVEAFRETAVLGVAAPASSTPVATTIIAQTNVWGPLVYSTAWLAAVGGAAAVAGTVGGLTAAGAFDQPSISPH